MNARTVILIVGLVLITGFLVYIALNSQTGFDNKTQQVSQVTPKPSSLQTSPGEQEVKKTTLLYFNPQTVSGRSGKVEVMVNSGKDKISGVQLELAFDPKVFESLTVTKPSPSFFGNEGDFIVLSDEVNKEQGRISYTVAITLGKTGMSGIGKVVTINYQLKPTTSSPTQLTFLNKTKVTSLGVYPSVLKDTTPLTINP